MSDQKSPDVNETTILPNPNSSASRWNFLKKLPLPWKKHHKTDQIIPEAPNSSETLKDVSIDEKKEPEVAPRQTKIGENFLENIRNKGLTITNGEFQNVGQPALEGTNERGSPVLFEKLKGQGEPPNGYLIGIGASNVFSMLEAFPEGTTPTAVVLFDIDPAVIEFGQYLIQILKDSPDELSSVIKKESGGNIFFPVYNANPEQAILKYAKVLSQLAQEGNFVIARADFNNPQLVQELSNLPNLKNLNNIVYLSNIADHLWRRAVAGNRSYLPDFSFLSQLQPQSPHQNYYIDTLTGPLNYNLRISTEPPTFKLPDFDPSLINHWQIEPTDLLEGPKENVVWEDLSQWDLNQILTANLALRSNPRFQEIATYIEKHLNEMRQSQLERYPELKQTSALPVEEREFYKDYQINLPETTEAEANLLAELAKPYSYERDFIPFVAHHIWQKADTPIQIDKEQIPKMKSPIIRDPTTNKRILVKDPRDWIKGQIELWWTGAMLSYEDLAAAKIYRELEKRIKDKNPAADTKGKTCQELSQELIG